MSRPLREIRADFDAKSIVVYQAYNDAIADAALSEGRFVAPFSMRRMTWIKPSFLWLMARSNWGQKSGQENILAIRIRRTGWERALSRAVLTSFEPRIHGVESKWRSEFENAVVHVQWDPERSIGLERLPYRAIQIGLSGPAVRKYVTEWIVRINDVTPLAREISALVSGDDMSSATAKLPTERPYPLSDELGRLVIGDANTQT